jgi:hypothetical protein
MWVQNHDRWTGTDPRTNIKKHTSPQESDAVWFRICLLQLRTFHTRRSQEFPQSAQIFTDTYLGGGEASPDNEGDDGDEDNGNDEAGVVNSKNLQFQ